MMAIRKLWWRQQAFPPLFVFFIVLLSSSYPGYPWVISNTNLFKRSLALLDSNPRRRLSSSWTRCYSSSSDDIEFLGYGKDAIVREGACIVAPPEEANHYLNDAAIFIYNIGVDSSSSPTSSGEDDQEEGRYVIRGVIIDMPTPFTMGEMAVGTIESDELSENLLFRGGEFGGDLTFMLHSDQELADLSGIEMIGSSGVYQGGLEYANSVKHPIDPNKAKFFFNYMEFTEQQLEAMFDNDNNPDDDDPETSWVSVAVPPEFILDASYDRGAAWARIRNVLRQRGELNLSS